jgi:hypothetical protein
MINISCVSYTTFVNEVQQLSSFQCIAGVFVMAYNQMFPARLQTVSWTS